MVIAPGQLSEEGWVPTRSAKPNQNNRSHSPDPRGGDRPSSRTIIYTDGACSGNPGPGGWAWVIPGGRYRSGAERHTTNQRMELAAALDAVRTVEGALEIVSDSTYVVNCFRNRWWEAWLRRDWANSKGKPVANRDLWEPLIEMYRARPIGFRLAGPEDDQWTGATGWLATEAARTQQGARGEVPQPPAW